MMQGRRVAQRISRDKNVQELMGYGVLGAVYIVVVIPWWFLTAKLGQADVRNLLNVAKDITSLDDTGTPSIGEIAHVVIDPVATAPLEDSTFNVSTSPNAIALRRRISWCQWHQVHWLWAGKNGPKYYLAWSDEAIDSSGFFWHSEFRNPAESELPDRGVVSKAMWEFSPKMKLKPSERLIEQMTTWQPVETADVVFGRIAHYIQNVHDFGLLRAWRSQHWGLFSSEAPCLPGEYKIEWEEATAEALSVVARIQAVDREASTNVVELDAICDNSWVEVSTIVSGRRSAAEVLWKAASCFYTWHFLPYAALQLMWFMVLLAAPALLGVWEAPRFQRMLSIVARKIGISVQCTFAIGAAGASVAALESSEVILDLLLAGPQYAVRPCLIVAAICLTFGIGSRMVQKLLRSQDARARWKVARRAVNTVRCFRTFQLRERDARPPKECPICYGDVVRSDAVLTTCCQMELCTDCANGLLARNSGCPQCRRSAWGVRAWAPPRSAEKTTTVVRRGRHSSPAPRAGSR